MSVPYPDPVLVEILAGLPVTATLDGRVSTVLDSVLPALRVTKVGDFEPPTTYEGTPLYQVEVWADDEFAAGSLAWALKNSWGSASRQVVGDALVHGRWVESDPFASPDPETDKPRYLITLGLRLSGAPA